MIGAALVARDAFAAAHWNAGDADTAVHVRTPADCGEAHGLLDPGS
jgi:hypothetical protein